MAEQTAGQAAEQTAGQAPAQTAAKVAGPATEEVLSASALALYERLVGEAAIDIEQVGHGLDEPAVRELLGAGFAEVTAPPERLQPVAPVAAFERLLAALQAEFVEHQRELVGAYRYLDDLQRRFLQTQPTSHPDGFAEVRAAQDGRDVFADAVAELVETAASDILSWNVALPHPPGPRGRAPQDRRVRTVYDTSFLHRHGGAELLRRARAAGEEPRIAEELASPMVVVDDAAALPLGTDSSGALVIRSPLVMDALRQFFDMVWPRAVPWIDRESADEVLSPVQRQVVALMAIGHSDDDVAAHLGLSLRTVRRHVADVMERLGVGTRFAAGIAAARAGLLENAELPTGEL